MKTLQPCVSSSSSEADMSDTGIFVSGHQMQHTGFLKSSNITVTAVGGGGGGGGSSWGGDGGGGGGGAVKVAVGEAAQERVVPIQQRRVEVQPDIEALGLEAMDE